MKLRIALFCIGIQTMTGCSNGSSGGVTSLPEEISSVSIAATSPADGSLDVPAQTVIEVSFNAPIDCASFSAAALALFHGQNQVAGTVECDGQKIRFLPAQPLENHTFYLVRLSSALRDTLGKKLAPKSWIFQTRDEEKPQVLRNLPLHDQQNVSLDALVQVEFSKEMAWLSVDIQLQDLAANPIAGHMEIIAQTATFIPDQPLNQLTGYRVIIPSTAADQEGNTLENPLSWTFTTTETVRPFIVNATPADGATGITPTVIIQVPFSEALFTPTLNYNSFSITDSLGNSVPFLLSYDAVTHIATMRPNYALVENADYVFSVARSVADQAGNGLAANYISHFRTRSLTCGSKQNLTLFQNPASLPKIASAGNRASFMGWIQKNSGATVDSIQAKRMDPSTGTWEATRNLDTDEANSCLELSIAEDSQGNAMYLWAQKVSGATNFDVYMLQYRVSAGWQSTPTLINTIRNFDCHTPQAAADASGRFYIVWSQDAASSKNIIYARLFDPSTGNFAGTTPLQLSVSNKETELPQIATSHAGRAVVLWIQSRESVFWRSIFRNATTGNIELEPGQSTNAISLSDTGDQYIARNARVLMDSLGNAVATFEQRKSSGADNYPYTPFFGRLASGSVIWVGATASTTHDKISTVGTGNASNLRAAMDSNGNVLAVWAQTLSSGGSGMSVLGSQFLSSGGQWQAAFEIDGENNSTDADASRVAIKGSRASIIWTQRLIDSDADFTITTNDYINLVSREYDMSSRSLISNSCLIGVSIDKNTINPELAIDASGHAFAVWQQTYQDNSEGSWDVWANEF